MTSPKIEKQLTRLKNARRFYLETQTRLRTNDENELALQTELKFWQAKETTDLLTLRLIDLIDEELMQYAAAPPPLRAFL